MEHHGSIGTTHRDGHTRIPENADDDATGPNGVQPTRKPSSSRSFPFRTAIFIILPILLSILLVNLTLRQDSPPRTSDPRFWAKYSPYYSVEEYQLPPDGCEVTQVNILQRHGARFPTSDVSKTIQRSVKKLQNASNYGDVKLEFLRSYEWYLGENDIVPSGAAQSYESGAEIYHRYGHLLDEDTLPFVRAAGSDRVVDSAFNWTAGFTDASGEPYGPTVSVIIPETKNSNNTLNHKQCPSFKSLREEMKLWRDTFSEPIVQRLNRLAVGAEIVSEDIPELMSLCALETAYEEKPSPFCDLFAQEEFEAYEYYQDLSFYYKTGYGNPLGRVQGVGYVNELLARLTGNPVEDHTQTNSTLDSSPETFPLNKTIYADFSHDTQMIAIYSALGLFSQDYHPTAANFDAERTWIVSRLVPFCGRMITEKLKCSKAGTSGDFVRILVNDAVQPLAYCGGVYLCGLDEFLQSQAYARSDGDGDFEKCFTE